MLVLSRHQDEDIVTVLDESSLEQLLAQVKETGKPVVLKHKVVDVRGQKVRIGVDAPRAVKIHRSEVWEAIQRKAQV